jgi:adenylate cyclase
VREQPRVRSQHYADRIARRRRILYLTTTMAVIVSAGFGSIQVFAAPHLWWTGVINIVGAAIYAMVPWLNRFGELVAPLTFIGTAYVSIFVICWFVGTGSGLQFYFLVASCLVVLQLGIDRIVLAAGLAAIAAGLVITLQFLVPRDTGVQPAWALSLSFVVTTISGCVMVVTTVWYAVREIVRAETAMEMEYERSEALLANILPASVAERLKDPGRNIIADKYDDASVLFADIAGFTERASDIAPDKLIRFLDQLYSAFDALVDKHGLEKIKVSGDSYMVVSGVPQPRPDHVEALADLAIDMAETASGLRDSHGDVLPLRIGPRRRGRGGFPPVLLRRVGGRGQRRIADGSHRLGGTNPGARGRPRAAEGRLRVAGAGGGRSQGQGRHAHVVSRWPQTGHRFRRCACRGATSGRRLTRNAKPSIMIAVCGKIR